MTEPTRWVVVDDRDSRIQYSEGWQPVAGNDYNGQGDNGPTYRNTLHAVDTDGATMQFTFQGNAVRIKGTIGPLLLSKTSGTWELLEGGARSTTFEGSNAMITCIGTGASLYGVYSSELRHTDGRGTYSIDGGPSNTFTIRGDRDLTMYNRNIFEVNGLSKRAHTIRIAYTSDTGSSTPLAISHFLVEGGTNERAPPASERNDTFTGTSPTTTNSSVPSEMDRSPDEGGSSSRQTLIGATLGSVLGVLTVSLLALLLLRNLRRRRMRVRDSGKAVDMPFIVTHERRGGTLSTVLTAVYKHRAQGRPSQVHAPVQHPPARHKSRHASVPPNLPVVLESPSIAPPPHPITASVPTNLAPLPINSGGTDSSPPLPLNVIVHEDSGLRIQVERGDCILELPPIYTVS